MRDFPFIVLEIFILLLHAGVQREGKDSHCSFLFFFSFFNFQLHFIVQRCRPFLFYFSLNEDLGFKIIDFKFWYGFWVSQIGFWGLKYFRYLILVSRHQSIALTFVSFSDMMSLVSWLYNFCQLCWHCLSVYNFSVRLCDSAIILVAT